MPANLMVLILLPYSLELSPVELHRLSLRQHEWSNPVYRDSDNMESAAMSGWRAVSPDPAKVRSICRCEYAEPES